MGISVPLLNEYKQDFFLRRFPRTITGGIQFKFGYPVPVYIYIAQFFVFLFPWLTSAPFVILIEVGVISAELAAYLYGVCVFLSVFTIHVISASLATRKKLTRPNKNKKTFTILDEEDEIDFDGLCGGNTITFLFPPKKYKLNIFIHSGVSGVICALALIYLLPSDLGALYSYNLSAIVFIFILGWLTVCISQYSYSSTAPPELAAYRALDLYGINCHTRPFYVLIFLVFYISTKENSNFLVWNQVLHAVMVTMPLLWTLGILPPIDALFSWLLEQVLVVILGGSPMASDLRLCVMVTLSTTSVIIVFLCPTVLASVCVAACLGYILSTDVCSLGSQLINTVLTRNKVSHDPGAAKQTCRLAKRSLFWRWGICECVYHSVMVALTFLMALLLVIYNGLVNARHGVVLGYVVLGVTIIEKYSRGFQSVYLCFGTVRNMFYPRSFEDRESFVRTKGRFRLVRWFHRFTTNWGAPIIMMTYLLMHLPLSQSTLPHHSLFEGVSKTAVLQCIAITRAFRWVWQSTLQCLLDISITHLIITVVPAALDYLGVFPLLLVVSFSRDRCVQLADKLYFFVLLLVTSIAHKKQRRTSSPVLVSITALLFPVVLFIVATSAFLSAPLLALFTVPVFVVGFPRPKRFWPETHLGCESVCADTIYYEQLNPSLTSCLRQLFADGSIGNPSAGEYYIARFQDKLAWITILERGAAYCTVNIKGLELQETSCHTVEVSHLDTIFKSAFDGAEHVCTNPYSFSVITPLDTAFISTYSSTRNVLTGIIDSPDQCQVVFAYLQKILVWVIVKYVRETKERDLSKQLKQLSTYCDTSRDMKQMKRTRGRSKPLQKKDSVISIRSIGKQTARVSPAFEMSDEEVERPVTVCSITKRRRSASQDLSLRSFTDSIFSDDFNQTRPTGNGSRVNPNWKGSKSYGSMSPPQSLEVITKDMDSFIEDLEIGLPAVDISETRIVSKPNPLVHKLPKINTNNIIYKPLTNLANSAEFTCPYSVNFSIPVKWRELPIDSSQLQKSSSKFPVEWYSRVLRTHHFKVVGKTEEEVFRELEGDEVLRNVYSQLTIACSSVFELSDLTYTSSAHQLYRCYMGELPWNAMMDWLTEEQDLFTLVLKSFRYAFKLMLDEFAYGAVADDDELMTYLQHYDSDWYIGLDSVPAWSQAVLNSVPNLFSLGQQSVKGVYTSHMLTTQQLPVHIGSLNPEVIRGQWANLALELYYLTNDDDERYSIQAHPSILRNLTVQAADPPLGYPIFSSLPISIPTI